MDRKVNILLVEDTLLARLAVDIILKTLGYHGDFAETGAKGILMAKEKTYDLIFMDIGLEEGTDGFLVTQEIKSTCELNKNTPVIALTAHSEQSYKDKAAAIGMVDFYQKPVQQEGIKAAVDKYVLSSSKK
jgi:CheY-like chemotaxis protein